MADDIESFKRRVAELESHVRELEKLLAAAQAQAEAQERMATMFRNLWHETLTMRSARKNRRLRKQ